MSSPSYCLRPVEEQDAERLQSFVRNLSPETQRLRFNEVLKELPANMLQRYLHPNAQHDAAIVAVTTAEPQQIIGVARYFQTDQPRECEFAIVVADEHRGRGIGSKLMHVLMKSAKEQHMERLIGWVLSDNLPMLTLMKRLGFHVARYVADPEYQLCIKELT